MPRERSRQHPNRTAHILARRIEPVGDALKARLTNDAKRGFPSRIQGGVANYLSHLEFDWESPVWRHWLDELSTRRQLVRYDERGCGLSDWDVDDFSLEAWITDLESVVEATGLQRFPLLGISQGGAVALAYAARHPERVTHLILYGAYARGRLLRSNSPEHLREAGTLLDLMRIGWGQDNPAFRQVFTTLLMPEATADQMNWFNELQRRSTSPQNAVRFEEAFFSLDATELAPNITTPTLVLHARADAMVPFCLLYT